MSKRRDKRNRVLRSGESIRQNGKYQYKYSVDGKPHFVYSWKLEPTDPLPSGRKPCLSLREKEAEIQKSLSRNLNPAMGNITVLELIDKYVQTKNAVRKNTRVVYQTVRNLMEKEAFGNRKIKDIRVSDAKIFLISLQDSGKGYSTIMNVRGVLRPAFQLAVDDDIIYKNPFAFDINGVIVNDSKTREAVSVKDMERYLDFLKRDSHYYIYYDAFYILFHTGLRLSEFCGLTVSDIDFESQTITIQRQLLYRGASGSYINPPKTKAGIRRIPITDEVAERFHSILDTRFIPKEIQPIDGIKDFLFYDVKGKPETYMHWLNRMRHSIKKYNDYFPENPLPHMSPHICRHTYCTNMAKSGMNPKTLQYLMGHSDISVTLNIYTHLGLDDAANELRRVDDLNKAKHDLKIIDLTDVS